MSDYHAQLSAKKQRLSALLAPYYRGEIAVHPSPATHHRLRAEFRIWHDDGQCAYVMTQKGEKPSTESVIRLEQLPAASARINALMPPLLNAINHSRVLRERLFQVEFLTTLRGDDLITLIYHRALDATWQKEAEALQQQLNSAIIGRSRKQKIILSRDYVCETLHVAGKAYRYRQYEGSFSQPNGVICEAMLAWAYQHNHQPNADLLELYCGNGNFTLPLSTRYRRVLATEISKSGIRALRENISSNTYDNLAIARLSAEEFSQAWRGTRAFNRLKADQIDLNDYDFAAVLVDPPRAGIDAATLTLLSEFNQITYISCNPSTLADNLAVLTRTHDITHAALFDQFPFTPHIECGVILRRR